MDLETKQIIDGIKRPNSINKFNPISVGQLEIHSADYQALYTTFNDINFNQLISFEGVDLSSGLLFENCTFEHIVNFNNVKTTNTDLVLNKDARSIAFIGCNFKDKLTVSGSNSYFEKQLYFESCDFQKGVEISSINITDGGLSIKSCTIKESFDIFNIKITNNLTLAGNNVLCLTRILNTIGSTLTFLQDNSFSEFLNVNECSFNDGIVFNNGLFKNEVHFELLNTLTSGLSIIGATFEKAFFVDYHGDEKQPTNGITSLYFSYSTFNNGIYVNGTRDLFAELPIVDSITIDISAKLKGDIVLRDIQVGILSMSGYNTSANISLERLFVNQIKIKALSNNAGLIFSAVRASYLTWYRDKKNGLVRENALYIDDTNFGKAQFFQTDFSAFKTIVFHNVICTDISTSLVKWFTPSQLDRGNEKSAKIRLKFEKKSKDPQRIKNAIASIIAVYNSKKEIYRQLKFASQKQGDIPLSLEFQSYEMNYYRKIVNLKRPINWSEKIILWSSQSNNFGQSWIKPVYLLLIFSFISFLPVGFLNSTTLDYSSFASSWSSVFFSLKVIFCDNFFKWIVLLNPVHSMKDINENIQNVPGIIILFDFISRIISSYFIFQIVSAFRKYFK